jgi:hypothetical protein
VVGSYVPISLRAALSVESNSLQAGEKLHSTTWSFSSVALFSEMIFRLYRVKTCPRRTFSFKKRPRPAFGILDRRMESSGNRISFENLAGSPASGTSLIRRGFATNSSPSGEKRGGGRLMRMEFMVDAQNIAHCPKQKDRLKAKI